MSFLTQAIERSKKKRAESRAFKQEIAKETLAIRRESFKKESLIQARKQGTLLARTPKKSIVGSIGSGLFNVAERATRPQPIKKAPVKRRKRRRKSKKK